jgi:type-F conjugative transfer system protein TrbI
MGFQDRDYVKEKHKENNQKHSMIEDKPNKKGGLSKLLTKCDQLIVIVVSVLIAFSVAYFFFSPTKIVAFDIKATTNTFLKQVASLNIDENQKNLMVKRYSAAMDAVIKEYQSQNYIVLVKDAVVSNVDDKTGEIQKKIAQKMKGKQE